MASALKALSEAEIARRIPTLAGWKHMRGAIRRTFVFTNFVESLRFVNKVGRMAEAANHHPDIDIRYSKVTLALSTHDVGGISKKDFDLAASIDARSGGRKRV